MDEPGQARPGARHGDNPDMAKHMTAAAETGDSATSTITANAAIEPPAPMKLLTARQAGELLGVSPETLERWRGAGTGPAFIRLSGRYIRYRQDDLEAFIQNARRSSTAG
ncbi:AlpA family transcriptional regulator [Acidocella sp.]|uniref:helix-turn-helix transcriptional regulator n=1 Tax=Acidocella sp. TaxID=50710 RepID=UPI0026219B1B|nr:helix-turn-helix domain-containing protein [Acidocella sp.]